MIMDFEEKCRVVEQCIPESPFRDQVKKLHDDMLDTIAGLEAACDSLSDTVYVLQSDA
jgi:hypothetical protein